ncbi:Allograft inflammatory factor 1-like [Mortierella sp. AD032]|nr:Allograft inflammatory factor 1-like [Mortierella sp. AD032]
MSPANITFSQEQIASFKESFDTFDQNHDGTINATELRSLLRIVGENNNSKDVSKAMQEFDTNKDNHIDFDEFLVLVSKIAKNKVPIAL